jgi:DNA-binding MarR family transcriptional regulator
VHTLDAPPSHTPRPSSDDSLRLAQVVRRALHSTDIASWCAVDLTMPQLKTLLLADAPAGVCHGEIARGLGVGVSTVTGIVDRLVEHGLVERHTAPEDRRLSRVRITPAGEDLLDRLWASRAERLGHTIAELSPDDRAVLHTALQHLVDLLGDQS